MDFSKRTQCLAINVTLITSNGTAMSRSLQFSRKGCRKFPPRFYFAFLVASVVLSTSASVYSQGDKGTGTGMCQEWRGGVLVPAKCRPDPTSSPNTGRRNTGRPEPEPLPDPRLSEALEQYEQGLKALNSGNARLAAQHLQTAVDKDPSSEVYRESLNKARLQIDIDDQNARAAAARQKQAELAEARRKLEAARGQPALKPIEDTNLFRVKSSIAAYSELRPLGNSVKRDFTGPHKVWKQLNCAVVITGDALSKAIPTNGEEASFVESRQLLGEALNALNGESQGVACGTAKPPPSISGRAPNLTRAVKKERELIERATVAIDELEESRRPLSEAERIADAFAKQKANEADIAARDDVALKQPRKSKGSPRQETVTVPSPPAKREDKPKRELEKIKEELGALLNFPLTKLNRPGTATKRPGSK